MTQTMTVQHKYQDKPRAQAWLTKNLGHPTKECSAVSGFGPLVYVGGCNLKKFSTYIIGSSTALTCSGGGIGTAKGTSTPGGGETGAIGTTPPTTGGTATGGQKTQTLTVQHKYRDKPRAQAWLTQNLGHPTEEAKAMQEAFDEFPSPENRSALGAANANLRKAINYVEMLLVDLLTSPYEGDSIALKEVVSALDHPIRPLLPSGVLQGVVLNEENDKCVWRPSKDGNVSIKSAYNLVHSVERSQWTKELQKVVLPWYLAALVVEARALCDGIRLADFLGLRIAMVHSDSLDLVNSIKSGSCETGVPVLEEDIERSDSEREE
ncbi:hypothetical protein Taro_002024 [Colocasia esculenta]|uniref:Uncharacterized protein n=1 Tax=Colocasia esculenta TaxID=4460 RepID=A0A843TFD4_COLES|nr:hypothetical protein [Colocasia esculenta]